MTEAAEKKKHKERKEKLKTRREWFNEAQVAINAYRRAEDDALGLPCISCGIIHPRQWHAGHYLSRGAHPELALEPRNIFRQCSQCNDILSGNQIEMRKGIIALRGIGEVEWLEGYHPPAKWSIDELRALRDEYRAKLKSLLAECK
jgi:hypothetical protein